MGRFFRVYHRAATDENHPLRADEREPVNLAIIALIKLFDNYKNILEQDKIKRSTDDQSKTMNKARSYNQVKAASTKSEFNNNNKQIEKN